MCWLFLKLWPVARLEAVLLLLLRLYYRFLYLLLRVGFFLFTFGTLFVLFCFSFFYFFLRVHRGVGRFSEDRIMWVCNYRDD